MLAQMSHARMLTLRSRGIWPLALALFLSAIALLAYTLLLSARPHSESITAPGSDKLPLSFEANAGQTGSEVRYMARASGGTFFFTPSEVVLSLRGADDKTGVLRTTFVGSSSQTSLGVQEVLPGRVNYLIGNDPSAWHTDLPTYAGVTYSQLYSGVDLTYSGTEGRLKSTYTLAPGADPASIRWRYIGANNVSVDAAGNLQLVLSTTNSGTLTATEAAPVAWQNVGGTKTPVIALFKVLGDGTVGFSLGAYNKNLPLVIDPTLLYSTYLGGSGTDAGYGIKIDSQGNKYVTGPTSSSTFPITNSLQPSYGGGSRDAYVTKINADGTALIYSTFLGSTGDDAGQDIELNSQNEVYLIGPTTSASFPISNAVQPSIGGATDGFLLKLNAAGSGLIFSTFIGGSSNDYAERLAIDTAGNAYVVGDTNSANFPTINAFQPSLNSSQDAFMYKISSDGTNIIFSTYFGGNGADTGYGAASDAQGNAYLSGYTLSSNLPITNAFQPIFGGGTGDGYLAKFSPSGSAQIFATYLGGSGDDIGEEISVDSNSNVYMTGYTFSNNFPTQAPFQPSRAGGSDAFVTKFNASGASLAYSSYLGGSANDIGSHLMFDAAGNAYDIGETSSTDFPSVDPIQEDNAGGEDAFVAKVNPSGSVLVYSTYLGGTSFDFGNDIALDGQGTAYIVGYTTSTDFPVMHPFQQHNAGSMDAFIAKIYELTTTPTPFPTSTQTDTPTTTPTNTPTNTPTATDTSTPTNTPTATPTTCPIQFEDVDPGSTFYSFVRCLACSGIINGYPCGNPEPCVGPNNYPYFRPSTNVTRGQLAKIVSESADFDNSVSGQTFEDIDEGSTFWLWVERLVVHDVMSGYPCGGDGEPCVSPGDRPYFRPNSAASRGQLTKIVSNAAGFNDPPVGQKFEDVAPGTTFYTFTQRLTSRLIMQGYLCGNPEPCTPPEFRSYFRPYSNVTRAQTAKIVTNTFFPNCSSLN